MQPDAPAMLRLGIRFLNAGFLGRVVRYGIVGVTVGVLNSVAIMVLVPLIQPWVPTVASLIAFFLVLPVGYLLHRYYSFADRAGGGGAIWRFVFTNIGSLIVSVSGMFLITEVMQLSYLFGIAWIWVSVPAMNFGIYMFWVFRGRVQGNPAK